MADKDRRSDAQPSTRKGKKVYARPTLTEYGSVAKLTMVKGTTQVEIAATKKSKCL